MKDPKRLFEEIDGFDRALLSSGRNEPPPEDLEKRVLGLVAASPALGSSTSRAGKLSFVRLLRPYHLVIAMAVVSAGTVVATPMIREHAAPTVVSPTSGVAGTRVPTTGPVALPSRESGADPPAASEPHGVVVTPDSLPSVPATTRAPAPTMAAPTGVRAVGNSPSTAASEVGASLEREIELLGKVKASLRAKAPSDAARVLDLYDAEFPTGELRPEATVLRVRTLLLQGDRSAAQKVADDYLAQHPNTVHARRIRALIAE